MFCMLSAFAENDALAETPHICEYDFAFCIFTEANL